MSKTTTEIVQMDEEGIRLDRWFKRHRPELPHILLQKLLRTGQIRVNGKRAEASTRLVAAQEIRLPPMLMEQSPDAPKKPDERLIKKMQGMVLFQDDDVIVLNKPAGLAVQGGTGLKENLDDMLAVFAVKGEKPKLVHRLDRETSGVLLVARTTYAATKLAEAFRHRDTKKIYWGLTVGVPKKAMGKITHPLVKDGQVMRVAEEFDIDAKHATTLYRVVESVKGIAAFVALWPITGRTHQLRVHMASVGHPLLGDPLYGTNSQVTPAHADVPSKERNKLSARDARMRGHDGKKNNMDILTDELGKGLHLHARRLIIPHPRKGVIDVSAPLAGAMKKSWAWFGFDDKADTNFDDVGDVEIC